MRTVPVPVFRRGAANREDASGATDIIQSGDSTAGSLASALDVKDSSNTLLLSILSDSQRAGGLRRGGFNGPFAGGRVLVHDELWVEDSIWADEDVQITSYETPGSTSLSAAALAGATSITVASVPAQFGVDKYVMLGVTGTDLDVRRIVSISGATITLDNGLQFAHASGTSVSGYRWRGSIYPINNFWRPGGVLRIGTEQTASEANLNPQTIDTASHVAYFEALASAFGPMIMEGGNVSAATPASMAVNVNGGRALRGGSNGPGYVFAATTQNNVAIAPADPANPRIDVVYWDTNGVAKVATGTPAPSPAPPSTPTNGTKLAEATVPAGATSIVSGNITDKRTVSVSFRPLDPGNQGTRLVEDSGGRYIRTRIDGAPTWVIEAVDGGFQPLTLNPSGGAVRVGPGGLQPAAAGHDLGSSTLRWDAFLNELNLYAATSFAGTLTHSITAARTWTLPDATGTIPLLGSAQTFSAAQTFTGNIVVGSGGMAISKHLSSTFSLDLAAPGAVPGCVDSAAQTLTGAAFGDTVVPSINGALQAAQILTAFVSAADQVTFRVCQFSGTPADPDGTGATYRADVWKH